MEHIYNYSSRALLYIKNSILADPFAAAMALLLIVLPFHYRYSSMALMLLAAVGLWQWNQQRKFVLRPALGLMVLFYVWMSCSWFWSDEPNETMSSLSKELPFVIIPLVFALQKPSGPQRRGYFFQGFGMGMVVYALGCMVVACWRALLSSDPKMLYYHALVSEDSNAIHMTQLAIMGFFSWLYYPMVLRWQKQALLVLSLFILLLSSKNGIVIWVLCGLVYVARHVLHRSYTQKQMVIGGFMALMLGFTGMFYVQKRWAEEWQVNFSPVKKNIEMSAAKGGTINNVSVVEAWQKPQFAANDYFSGTALRVYMARLFFQLEREKPMLWCGLGQDASEKAKNEQQGKDGLYEGYKGFNFHNQYLQTTAELGLIGLLLLLAMLVQLFRSALMQKDFLQFVFAVLMISLFLTESFLARQRGILFFVLLYAVFQTNSKKTITR